MEASVLAGEIEGDSVLAMLVVSHKDKFGLTKCQKTRDNIVRYLSRCSDIELREILFAIFQTRRPNPEEDKYSKNCFFLGTASNLLENSEGEPGHWGEFWEIGAVAYVDKEYREGELEPDWGFCQFGKCQSCGIAVRSNLKQGICSVCGSKVYVT